MSIKIKGGIMLDADILTFDSLFSREFSLLTKEDVLLLLNQLKEQLGLPDFVESHDIDTGFLNFLIFFLIQYIQLRETIIDSLKE